MKFADVLNRVRCWVGVLVVFLIAHVPATASPFSLHLSGLPIQPLDLAAFAGYFRDSTTRCTLAEIQEQSSSLFRPLATIERPFSRNEDAYWVYFELHNDSADSVYLLIRSEFRLDHFDLYSPSDVTRRAGLLVAVQRLAYPANYRCLPLEVGPHERRSFYLRLKQDCYPIDEGKLWLSTYAQEETWRKADTIEHLSVYHYYTIFFAGTGLLLILVLILFFYHPGEKALVYYALYLALVILFYLRNFENWHNDIVFLFKYFREWHYPFEILLSYGSYAAYLFFVLYLLDLDQKRPRLSLGFRILAGLFGVLLSVNLFLMVYKGLAASMDMLRYVRIFFFIVAIPGLVYLVRRLHTVLAYVVFFGTLLMLLGALLPAFGYWLNGQVERVSHTAWGWVHFENWRYPFYDFKLGALLESLCFFIGLNYKISRRSGQHSAPFATPSILSATSVTPDEPETDFMKDVLALCQARLAEETFGPLYILVEKCTKFQLKSAPLIGVKDHFGRQAKVIANDDKYAKETRDPHPAFSGWAFPTPDCPGVGPESANGQALY